MKNEIQNIINYLDNGYNSHVKFAYTEGKKYGKIESSNGGVFCFIVLGDDDPKFKKGDILKPASWRAPTRNFSRGNVANGYNGSIYGL